MGPFDRFNDRAKRVLALAQDEAIRFNHNYIGTEHLIMGLIREGEGTAARVLDSLGVDLSSLRRTIDAMVGRGDATKSPSEITLSPQVKSVINFAVDEARKLGHSHVGTEHLLLGLVREGDETTAKKALESLGVTLESIRHRVIATLGQQHPPTAAPSAAPSAGGFAGPFDRFNDGAKRVLALAQDEAIRFKHNYIGTEHLLLGLIREGQGVAARALQKLGVDLAQARTAVSFIIGQGDAPTAPSEITLSPRTKKIVELAIDEARRLGHRHVGTEHMLLGLAREGEGIASGILESLGITMAKVREVVMEMLGLPESAPPTRGTSRQYGAASQSANQVLLLAEDEATAMRHNHIGTEHLLLGLLRMEPASNRVLTDLGVTLERARADVLKIVPAGPGGSSGMTMSPRLQALIGYAKGFADGAGTSYSAETLLLALVSDPAGVGAKVLEAMGVTAQKVREALEQLPPR
ncbi:MAG: Clp protease N-terminal domain-containing protein [Chloroflexota bacterium]